MPSQGKALPIYGDGLNIRDWLHVEDHREAIYSVFQNGNLGETYLVGGGRGSHQSSRGRKHLRYSG